MSDSSLPNAQRCRAAENADGAAEVRARAGRGGLPNKLIAYELGLCETTVKAHVSEILRKLCVYNRARAIALLADIDFRSVHLLLTRSPANDEAAQPTA